MTVGARQAAACARAWSASSLVALARRAASPRRSATQVAIPRLPRGQVDQQLVGTFVTASRRPPPQRQRPPVRHRHRRPALRRPTLHEITDHRLARRPRRTCRTTGLSDAERSAGRRPSRPDPRRRPHARRGHRGGAVPSTTGTAGLASRTSRSPAAWRSRQRRRPAQRLVARRRRDRLVVVLRRRLVRDPAIASSRWSRSSETAAAIADGDLSRRIPPRPRDDRGRPADPLLNGMLAQIETAFRRARAGVRGPDPPVRRRRLARAAYAARLDPGLRRAVPAGRRPEGGRAAHDAPDRGGGHPDGPPRRGPPHARPARPAPPAEAEPVDLAVLAGDAVHDVRGLAPDRPVRLVGLDDARGPFLVVTGDESGLRQVVTNLVANAVRHTPPGRRSRSRSASRPGERCSRSATTGRGCRRRRRSGCSSGSTGSTPAGGAATAGVGPGPLDRRRGRRRRTAARSTSGPPGRRRDVPRRPPRAAGGPAAGVSPASTSTVPGRTHRELPGTPEAASSRMALDVVIRRREVNGDVQLPRARA